MSEALQIPADARGRCRSCGKEVLWVKTVRASKMPLDVEEQIGKGLVLFAIDATGVARKVEDGKPGRESHFATCAQAAQWRKPR